MKKEFHYYSRQVVRVGDRVQTGSGRFGVVEEIFQPGPQSAEWYGCPKGGMQIIEDWEGGKSSRIIITPRDGDWQEVKFIGRKISQ
jgi:hypothetical protein